MATVNEKKIASEKRIMKKTEVLIVQEIETVIELEYESDDDLEKQVREMESLARNHLCSKKSTIIKKALVLIEGDYLMAQMRDKSDRGHWMEFTPLRDPT
tara:strand:+ start:226 stop:525 length:300 start_codon:yes stop_codon:yes gene_type:complete